MPVRKLRFVFLFLIAFIYSETTRAQCCSTGSPVGASVYVGVLGKNSLRVITYYRHNFSDSYFEGTKKSTENNQLKSSDFNFIGFALAYGITKRLTIEADMGYFINKTQVFNYIDFQEKGFGLSNGGVTVKYGAFVLPSKQLEITLGAGFRYPFTTKPQQKEGVQLSRDVQPSTNAFCLSGLFFVSKGFPSVTMKLFTINRFDHNFEDPLHYKYGDVLLNSVFVSKQIVKYFLGIVQVRSECRWKDEDTGDPRVNTGNYILIVSPQLSYSIAGKWNVSVLFDFPVYKDYIGKQLTPKYSFAISLTRDFNLSSTSKAAKQIKQSR